MHPEATSCVPWWQAARRAFLSHGGVSCGPGGRSWGGGDCGPSDQGPHGDGGGDGDGGGAFGVRRPLRFLAYRLELDERQVGELARILNELKTERAQAEVDRRRSVSAFADAIAGTTFDAARAGEGGELRVHSAERVRDAVLKALREIHALLDDEQRRRLATLVRTGTLTI